jgi:peptide/nickel transport system substrate-binding protein
MRRLVFLLVAASALMLVRAEAAVRPRYGGTLRVAMRASVVSPVPAAAQPASQERLSALIFEPLVVADQNGQPRPALASSWRYTADYKRWQFWLRSAKLHDGSSLTSAQVMASLNAANPRAPWRMRVEGESVIFESPTSLANLAAELAQQKNAIQVRNASGETVGTGPFRISEWQPKRAVLVAHEEHWNGRPFLDAIEVALERPLREQIIDLELGRADVIEVPVDQVRRAQQSRRIVTSAPIELFVIVFTPERRPAQDAKLREALALSIDRKAIHEVLLQRQGEPVAGLLPQWISGYAFLFPTQQNAERARQLRNEVRPYSMTLNYDFADPLARSIAERIALNAQEVGLSLRPVSENLSQRTTADAKLVRVRLRSADPATALATLSPALGTSVQLAGAAPEHVLRAERSVVDSFTVIPVAATPEACALSQRVKNWSQPKLGGWPLAWGEVWVEGKE